MPSPNGQNASYTLNFRAPQVSCEEKTTNYTVSGPLSTSWIMFNSSWDRYSSLTVTKSQYYGWFPVATYDTASDGTFTFLVQSKALECKPMSAQYKLNVSYLKGIREIQYTKQDTRPLPFNDDPRYTWHWPETRDPTIDDVPVDTPEFKNWTTRASEMLTSWNAFAILDASFQSMQYTWNQTGKFSTRRANFTLPNGTQVEGNPWVSTILLNNCKSLL